MTKHQMNRNILAIDTSGSTDACEIYWRKVYEIYHANKNFAIISWSNIAGFITSTTLLESIWQRRGCGGTNPETIVELLKNHQDFPRKLIVVTDGEVGSIDALDASLVNCKIEEVDCFIINGKMDVSIVLPFARIATRSKTFFFDTTTEKEQQLFTNVVQTRKDLEKLMTFEEFSAKFKDIEDYARFKCLGKSENKELHFILVKLKNVFAKQYATFDTLLSDELCQSKDSKQVIKICDQITEKYFKDDKYKIIKDIYEKFNILLSLTSGHVSGFDLNDLKYTTLVCSEDLEECDGEIECPLTCENSFPVIILDKRKALLSCLTNDEKSRIRSNPLCILNDEKLMKELKSSITNVASVFYFNKSKELNAVKNPYTRNDIMGVIPLGPTMNHVKKGNETLNKLFTDDKTFGNVGLYWIVFYFAIMDLNRFDDEIKQLIRNHMIFRLKNTIISASLGGNCDGIVSTRMPMSHAIYFTIFSAMSDLPGPKPIFNFLFSFEYLNSLMKLLNYEIPQEIDQRISVFKIVTSMLKQCKQDKDFFNKIKRLYQNHLIVNENCVFLDFEPNESQIKTIMSGFPQYYDEISKDKLIYLSGLVSPGVKFSDIRIDWTMMEKEIPSPTEQKWTYEKDFVFYSIEICEKTCRPYLLDQKTKEPWNVALKKRFPETDKKIISLYLKYGKFICKFKKFPENDEFILFLKNEYSSVGTLPYGIQSMISKLFSRFAPMREKYTSEMFGKIFDAGKFPKDRLKLEN